MAQRQELPLPGGQAGATVRLHPIRSGEILAPPGLLHRRRGPFATALAIGIGVPRSRRVWIPVPIFLVEHPGAGPLLIDTGLHSRAESDASATMGRVSALLYRYRGARPATDHLRERGIDPGDVRLVLMTHLHSDHAGGIRELPGRTYLADAAERRATEARGAWTRGYTERQLGAPADWLEVDFEGGQPLEQFDRTLDLFGDGSVRLLSTPGHTPGHQSVLLRLAGRNALITGDAAYTARSISHNLQPGIAADAGAARESLSQLGEWVEAHPRDIVIPGHDPAAWAALNAVYE